MTRREMVKFLTLGSLLLASANWATVVASRLLHRGFARGTHTLAQSALWNRAGLDVVSLSHECGSRVSPSARPKESWLPTRRYARICRALWCMTKRRMVCSAHATMDCSILQASRSPVRLMRPLPRVQLEQRGDQLFAVGMEAV